MKVSLAGGTPITLGQSAVGQDWPTGLAVDPTDANAYWVINATGLVEQLSLAGGQPITLVPAYTSQDHCQLAGVDQSSVYWTCTGSGQSSGTVMKVAIGGGSAVTLASGLQSPASGAIDAASVYFATSLGSNYTVTKVALGGGAPALVASGLERVRGLTVDASNVYWAGNSANCKTTVMKVATGGGTPVTLISGQTDTFDVAVDATSVYWTDRNGGTVMQLPK
jgi:hypothetical protein